MKYNKKINRRKIIYIGIIVFLIFFIISIFLMLIAIKKVEKVFMQYSDNKNLEYKVILKENEYYKEPHLEKGNQYIANLINTISTNFKYNFNLPTQYNYSYKIVGTADVIDEKTNRTIYTFAENLLPEQTGQCDGELVIDQNVNVEFDKYNNLIKQFVNSYDLKNISCNLSLNLSLEIDSPTQQFAKQNINVMNLDIPLAKNTIAIDTRQIII